jgi:hypothetical protein
MSRLVRLRTNGHGEEILATESGHGGTKMWLPLPAAHQAESIDKVVDKKCNAAHEKAARENRRIPECKENNLGHIGVPFSQLHRSSTEAQIHTVLCFCPWCREMPLYLSANVDKLQDICCYDFSQKECVNLLNQSSVFRYCRRKGSDNGKHDSRVHPVWE